MRDRTRQTSTAGFTLMEVLVALGIFGLAAVALLHVQSENVRTAATIRERVLADIVAENVLIEAYLQDSSRLSAPSSGLVDLGGRSWEWSQSITPTGNAAIERLDVAVSLKGNKQVIGTLSGFRGAP